MCTEAGSLCISEFCLVIFFKEKNCTILFLVKKKRKEKPASIDEINSLYCSPLISRETDVKNPLSCQLFQANKNELHPTVSVCLFFGGKNDSALSSHKGESYYF